MPRNNSAAAALDALLRGLAQSRDPLVRNWATWLAQGDRSEGGHSKKNTDNTSVFSGEAVEK
jgi:hypothetical protein